MKGNVGSHHQFKIGTLKEAVYVGNAPFFFPPNKVVMVSMSANSCLSTQPADTQQHQHSTGVQLVSTRLNKVYYSLSFSSSVVSPPTTEKKICIYVSLNAECSDMMTR